MNDQHVAERLRQYILAANEHQRLDREHRREWRYRHKQEAIRPAKRDALTAAERAQALLLRAVIDLGEPTYLTRLARDLMEKWDAYRRNHAIMVAEYHNENQKRTATSRNIFETALKEAAEKLKAYIATNQQP